MYRLLLVDDFFVERENVKDIIAASGLDLTVVGEAANGREALALLEREPPDFVLTDIEMPLMNGLQLAEQVRSRYPGIHVIFFTLYDKFEYARRALQLGAHSFILKPIDRDELIAALQQMIALRRQEEAQAAQAARLRERLQRSMPLLLAQFRRDLFAGTFTTATEVDERLGFFDIAPRGGGVIVLAAQAAGEGLDELESVVNRELFALRLTAAFEEALAGQAAIWTGTDPGHWAFALYGLPAATEQALTLGYNFAERLLSAALAVHIRASIGVSRLGADLLQVPALYREARQALSYEFGSDAGRIVTYEDIQARSLNTAAVELQGLLKEVSEVVGGDAAAVVGFVDHLLAASPRGLTQAEAQNLCFDVALCVQIVLRDLNASPVGAYRRERAPWDVLLKLDSIRDMRRWLTDLLTSAQRTLRDRSRGQSALVVTEARRFIEANYSKPISVQSVALHVRYSANYLNNLFRQETGETLLDCLTRVRIDQAKRLLAHASPGTKMYEIVEAVGYTHEAHFRTLFKQYTGLTPKEYREKAQGGGSQGEGAPGGGRR